MVNQVPSTLGSTGGGYEKYRPSYGGSRDSKESYNSGPRGGMSSKREGGGTIDVIGANSNSRRPLQGPPPPLEDSGPPPPVSYPHIIKNKSHQIYLQTTDICLHVYNKSQYWNKTKQIVSFHISR